MTDLEDTIVEEATSREKFDVISFFSGASLPTEKVTVYRDIEAAYELNKIYDAEKAREKANKKKNTDNLSIADADPYDADAIEGQIEEYRARLDDSAVTFHLRGLAPAAQSAITKSLKAKLDPNSDEYNAAFFGTLIAKTIQYVTNSTGARDDSKWTTDRVDDLAENLPAEAFAKLSEGVLKVTYAGNSIDQAVSADF